MTSTTTTTTTTSTTTTPLLEIGIVDNKVMHLVFICLVELDLGVVKL